MVRLKHGLGLGFLSVLLVVSAPSLSHSGKTDMNGCHKDNSTGEDHCHQVQVESTSPLQDLQANGAPGGRGGVKPAKQESKSTQQKRSQSKSGSSSSYGLDRTGFYVVMEPATVLDCTTTHPEESQLSAQDIYELAIRELTLDRDRAIGTLSRAARMGCHAARVKLQEINH